jgi:Flp pilus assembly protein TadG
VVEFVFLGTLLLVPVVYFVIAVSQVQAASFAVVNAADQAAKVYAGSEEPTAAGQAAHQAALLAAGDFGFGTDRLDLNISCGGGACLEAGSSVTTDVAISVPLPLLAGTGLTMATVNSSSTQIVERYG